MTIKNKIDIILKVNEWIKKSNQPMSIDQIVISFGVRPPFQIKKIKNYDQAEFIPVNSTVVVEKFDKKDRRYHIKYNDSRYRCIGNIKKWALV